jgi:hypothetical protein
LVSLDGIATTAQPSISFGLFAKAAPSEKFVPRRDIGQNEELATTRSSRVDKCAATAVPA